MRAELKAAADTYFETTGLNSRGGVSMVLKTLTFFAWAGMSYGLLVFAANTWITSLLLSTSLGLAIAGIGFCVMHDGGHGAYSTRSRLNRLAALSLDMLGASSFVWNFKHNVLHHTYTNIEGADDDIEFQPFFRLTRSQPRHWFHRLQFLYWPVLLCFLTTKWILLDDIRDLWRGEIAGHPMARPSRRDLAIVALGKLSFLSYAVAIPLLVHAPLAWLAGYTVASCVAGITLGTVFQLAHAVEDASFFGPDEALPLAWAEHQIATTVDFARTNRLFTWYVGGLNFQLEHHLFPRVSHKHYPALAPLVRQVCERNAVAVLEHRTLGAALMAHIRHLYQLGRPEPAYNTHPSPAVPAELEFEDEPSRSRSRMENDPCPKAPSSGSPTAALASSAPAGKTSSFTPPPSTAAASRTSEKVNA